MITWLSAGALGRRVPAVRIFGHTVPPNKAAPPTPARCRNERRVSGDANGLGDFMECLLWHEHAYRPLFYFCPWLLPAIGKTNSIRCCAESLTQTDTKRKVRGGADADWAGILPYPILLVNTQESVQSFAGDWRS